MSDRGILDYEGILYYKKETLLIGTVAILYCYLFDDSFSPEQNCTLIFYSQFQTAAI